MNLFFLFKKKSLRSRGLIGSEFPSLSRLEKLTVFYVGKSLIFFLERFQIKEVYIER